MVIKDEYRTKDPLGQGLAIENSPLGWRHQGQQIAAKI